MTAHIPTAAKGATNGDWLLEDTLAPPLDNETLGALYEGAARAQLVLPFCTCCGLALELEQKVCDGCGTSGPEWRAVEPHGWVHSVTVVHRLEPSLVRTDDPYPVADVELLSGHRLVLTAVAPAQAPAIGDSVSIGFRCVGGVAVPAFHHEASPAEPEESR